MPIFPLYNTSYFILFYLRISDLWLACLSFFSNSSLLSCLSCQRQRQQQQQAQPQLQQQQQCNKAITNGGDSNTRVCHIKTTETETATSTLTWRLGNAVRLLFLANSPSEGAACCANCWPGRVSARERERERASHGHGQDV